MQRKATKGKRLAIGIPWCKIKCANEFQKSRLPSFSAAFELAVRNRSAEDGLCACKHTPASNWIHGLCRTFDKMYLKLYIDIWVGLYFDFRGKEPSTVVLLYLFISQTFEVHMYSVTYLIFRSLSYATSQKSQLQGEYRHGISDTQVAIVPTMQSSAIAQSLPIFTYYQGNKL